MHVHVHALGGAWRVIEPHTPVSTFMRSGLHMLLISTHCCLVYLSEGLTPHLLSQTEDLLRRQMDHPPPYVSSTNIRHKRQLPRLYGASPRPPEEPT